MLQATTIDSEAVYIELKPFFALHTHTHAFIAYMKAESTASIKTLLCRTDVTVAPYVILI